MTEAEWLSSDDPARMMYFLQHGGKWGTWPGDRKLRLFACACVRQVWHLLTDPRTRRAVEVAERWVEGSATVEDYHDAWEGAWEAAQGLTDSHSPATAIPWLFGKRDGPGGIAAEVSHRLRAFLLPTTQASLLRDIVGNPFRPLKLPPAVAPGDKLQLLTDPYRLVPWTSGTVAATVVLVRGTEMIVEPAGSPGTRASWSAPPCPWLTPDVLALARAAYEERPGRKCQTCNGTGQTHDAYPGGWSKCDTCHGTGRIADGTLDPLTLAALADALEEAGCTDEAILRHLRGEEPVPNLHLQYGDREPVPLAWRKKQTPCVRGCHVLDTLLGKD